MHVQSAEQIASGHDLEVFDKLVVARLVRVPLVLPVRKRMRAACHDSDAVRAADTTEFETQLRKRVARLLGRVQDRGDDFQLRLMQFFAYAHLPPHLQVVSRSFGELAEKIVADLPSNPERTVALRKLLEAKDCAVRALLYKEPN